MLKKLFFLLLCLVLSLSSHSQAAQSQNQNDALEKLSSHDLKTLTEAATDVINNLSDEDKTLIEEKIKESNVTEATFLNVISELAIGIPLFAILVVCCVITKATNPCSKKPKKRKLIE